MHKTDPNTEPKSVRSMNASLVWVYVLVLWFGVVICTTTFDRQRDRPGLQGVVCSRLFHRI